MNVYGDIYRDTCPVCGSESVESGYWRLPLISTGQFFPIYGALTDLVPCLNATSRFDWDRCEQCEAVYLNPLAEVQGHGASDAAKRFENTGRHSLYQSRFERVARWISVAAETVVDVASGAGELLDMYRWAGGRGRTVGLDCCQVYTDWMRQHGHDAYEIDLTKEKVSWKVTNADFIIFSEAFEHMRDALFVMRGIVEALRPGGRVFFSAQALGTELPIRPSESIYVTSHTVTVLLSRLGLSVLEARCEAGRWLITAEV